MPTIDNLVVEIESNAAQASSGIDSLSAALDRLRSVTSNFRGLTGVASSMEKVKQTVAGLSGDAAVNLNKMTDALNKMSALNGVKISSSIAAQIKAIGEATRGLEGTAWGELKSLADGFAPLANIQKANGLNSTVNALKKLPEAMQAVTDLDASKVGEFADRVEELRAAVHPLADEMRAVSAGFSALPSAVQKAIRANQKMTQSTKTTTHSLHDMLKNVVSLSAALYGIRKVFDFAMKSFEKSNDYVEALNLAEVAMGNGAKAATEYAQKVEDLVGIDMTEWMTNLGVFNQQLIGLGIPEATANRMSQQLTQLGYDLQSVFNAADVSQVMDRLSSGITGQIKGMREYGVELSVAAMQEYALSKGIETSWNQMSQAQKVALRYSKIMASTTNIQHDLARTLITPANSLRILSNQLGVAQRYFGQLVSVIAVKVIPWIQAFVQIVGQAAKALAAFFGFSLPEIGAIGSGLNTAAGGAEDLETALGGAGGAAKKASDEVKGLLASWDEINIIQQQNDSSRGGGGGGGAAALEDIGDLWGLGDYTYDFLDGIQSKVDGIISTIKGFIPQILSTIAAIAAYGIASKLLSIADSLDVSKDILMGMKNIFAGLALTIVGTTLTWSGIDKIVNGEGFTVANVLETIAGNVANVFGFMLIGRGIGKLAGLGGVHAFAFGIGMSLAIDGIALAFAAEKNMIANGVNAKNVMMAIAGSLAGGLGATIAAVSLGAAFPIALTLGAIVSAAIGIGIVTSYINDKAKLDAQDRFKAEVLDAFGSVKLTDQEANLFAQSILGDDFHLQLTYTLSAFESLDAMKSTIQTTVNDLDLLDYKVSIGMKLTPDEVIDYGNQVGTLAEQISNYVIDSGKAIKMSLELVQLDSSSIDNIVSNNATWIQEIGKRAQSLLSQAFDESGGLVNIDAKQEADKYIAKLNEINNLIQEAQAEARLSTLEITYSGVELSAESAGMVSAALVDYLQTENEAAQKIYESTYGELYLQAQIAKMRFDEDPTDELRAEWDAAVKAFDDYVASNPLEEIMRGRRLKVSDWLTNTWGETLGSYFMDSSEMAFAADQLNRSVSGVFEQAKSEVKYGISQDTRDLAVALWDNAYNAINEALQDVHLSEDAIEWANLFAGYGGEGAKNAIEQLRIGEDLSKDIVDGLNNYMIVAAQTGTDADALWYVVGQQFANSPDYFNLLNTMKGLGSELNEYTKYGIAANVDVARDGAGLIITALDGTIIAQFPEISDTLENNIAALGIDIPPYANEAANAVADAFVVSSDPATESIQQLQSDIASETAGIGVETTVPVQAEVQSVVAGQAIETGLDTVPVTAEIQDILPPDATLYENSLTQMVTDAGTAALNAEANMQTYIPAADLSSFNSSLSTWESNALSAASRVQSILNGVSIGGTSTRLGGMIRANTGASNYSAAIAAIPTIKMYAGGGMPKEGELFIANEQGPELVGRIGGSSAVANDDQIVDGIAAGVAWANREQNAYYQRMISLLERLCEKENEVVIRPSANFGKTVSRSIEMFDKVRG